MRKLIFDRRHQKWLEVEELQPARGASVAVLPGKKLKRDKFAMFPLLWRNRLALKPRASGTTYDVAIYILYEDWRVNEKPFSGRPFKLSNKAPQISPMSKWRALADLERRKLIVVDRRLGRSPRITLLPLK
jgi:hypothetical protein